MTVKYVQLHIYLKIACNADIFKVKIGNKNNNRKLKQINTNLLRMKYIL